MIEKQCQFHGQSDSGVFVHLLHAGYDNDHLVKQASISAPLLDEVQYFMKNLYKRDGMIYTLVSALGAGEFWGSNSNGDFFPESSLIHTPRDWNLMSHAAQKATGSKWEWGYPTFYNAHAFQHHVNKDPARAFGTVEHACWDPCMKRVLLVVGIDRARAHAMGAHGVVDRIENGEFPDVSMGCLPKYAKILRKDGTVDQIANIAEGDEVISHRGVPRTVTSTMVRPHRGEIYRVKVYGHRDPIVLTEEHPMWVVRKSHTECRPSSPQVNKGRKQRVCTPESRFRKIGCSECETVFAGQFEWVRADEVDVGDYLALPIPTFTPSRRFTADEARILGYYLAEGHVVMNSAGTPRSVTFSTNLHANDIHEEIRSIVSRAGLEDSLSEIDVEERNGKYITVNDVDLASLCYDNCSKGSRSKVMSDSLMGADPETLQLFLGAYANGDGGCYKGSIYLSTSSEHLSDQLRIALARIGCIASVNKIIHKPSKRSVVCVETVEYQVWIGTDTSHLFTGSRFTPGQSKRVNNKRFFYEYEGVTYLMSPVESIEVEDYDDEVFNFSVEEDESYLVEGLAVHNCRVPYDLCSICTEWDRITGNKSKDLAEHRRSPIRGLSITTKDYCFPPGTPILLADGTSTPIEAVAVNEQVITAQGNARRVVHTMQRDVSEEVTVLNVTGLQGELVLTNNHPCYVVKEADWAKGHMSRTQQRALGGSSTVDPTGETFPQELPASEVRPGDRVVFPIPREEEDLGLPDALVSLLGWYLAQGHVAQSGNKRPTSRKWYNVELTHDSLKQEHVAEIVGTAEVLGLRTAVSPDKGKQSVTITIYGEWFAEQCVTFCGRGSRTKKLAEEVLRLPARQQLLLLQAYAKGDGSISNEAVRLVTTSDDLASQLPLLLARCGMVSHVQLDERETNYGHQRNWFVAIPLSYAESLGGTPPKWSNSKTRISGDYVAYRVKDVRQEHYEGPVYNFEVEGDHSYVAGGIAVHNCQHLQFETGRLYPDGRKVWMWNLHPRFFDISFVYIGADKASKVMAKLGHCPIRADKKKCASCIGDRCAIPSAHVHDVWNREKTAAEKPYAVVYWDGKTPDGKPTGGKLELTKEQYEERKRRMRGVTLFDGSKRKTAGIRYIKFGTKGATELARGAQGSAVAYETGRAREDAKKIKEITKDFTEEEARQLREAFEKRSSVPYIDPREEAEVSRYFKAKRGNKGRVKLSSIPLHKQAEIIKQIRSHFSSALPDLDEQEPNIPDDTLKMMSGRLSDALSTAGSMGIVLKPREFQRSYLHAMDRGPLADDLDEMDVVICTNRPPADDFKLSGQILPAILRSLMPMIQDRSSFGPVLHRRMLRMTIAKPGQPTRTIVMDSGLRGADGSKLEDHPLLQKIGSAYSAYRKQLIYKVASLAPRMIHEHPEVVGEIYKGSLSSEGLVKVGADVVQSILGMFPATYLNRAYLPEPVSGFVEEHCNLGGLQASGELAERGGVA